MRHVKQFTFEIVGPALLVSWFVYIVFNSVVGSSGFRVLAKLEQDAVLKTTEVEGLVAKRRALEARADMLNPKNLDPDMVDESIRSVLGYVHQDDIVLPRQELDRLLKKNR